MLTSWSSIVRDGVLTYLILYQTWSHAPSLVIYFVIYNWLDSVCIKLVGWTLSFVFPDRIQIPKTQLAYSTFRPCTPSSDPMFPLNLQKK